jgi:hypothetical protein
MGYHPELQPYTYEGKSYSNILVTITGKKQPGRTVRFAFFTLEEPPVFRSAFMGSAVYAERACKNGKNSVAMICLETIGYYHNKKGG